MEKIKSYLYEGSEVILLDPNDVPGFISLVAQRIELDNSQEYVVQHIGPMAILKNHRA